MTGPHAPAFYDSAASPLKLMRDAEEDCGFHLVTPGTVEWLRRPDWHHDTVISLDGRAQKTVVRLVLLVAMRPGSGTLRRLLSELWFRDLIPAVIEPHARLANFLYRYGYSPRRAWRGRMGWQEWRPVWPDDEGFIPDIWHDFTGARHYPDR